MSLFKDLLTFILTFRLIYLIKKETYKNKTSKTYAAAAEHTFH